MAEQPRFAVRSQLERDLAIVVKDENERRTVIRDIMELMSSIEDRKVLISSYPACNSEG